VLFKQSLLSGAGLVVMPALLSSLGVYTAQILMRDSTFQEKRYPSFRLLTKDAVFQIKKLRDAAGKHHTSVRCSSTM
jgi:hypothetical protein